MNACVKQMRVLLCYQGLCGAQRCGGLVYLAM